MQVKSLIESKTLWFNGLTILLGLALVAQEWVAAGDFSMVGLIALTVSLCNFGLRLITTTALK